MQELITIRKAHSGDENQIWKIASQVIKNGDTYVFNPSSSQEVIIDYWLSESHHTYVAILENQVCGTYLLKDNQPDLGSHIANGSYMVHPDFRGKGIGELLGTHSINEARGLGYSAIQFNIVVKTNESAVRLWKKLGFEVIGEIPEAFQHQKQGLTNAYIMYRKL